MGSPPLPQFVVLTTAVTRGQKIKRPMLSCRREWSSTNRPKDRLEFIFTEASNDTTVKFAIERSSFNNELVHIRCCDNNKYVVRRKDIQWSTQGADYIDATADKPEEDTSLWSCTLFRIEYVTYNHGYYAHRFKHVQSGKYIVGSVDKTGIAYLQEFLERKRDLYDLDFHDWSSIVILPKQVIFKGINGKYLAVVRHPNGSPNLSGVHGYTLQFSKDDPADASAHHELEMMQYNHEGTLYIKSLYNGLSAPSNQTYWYSATQFNPPRPLYLSGHDRATSCTPVKVNANTIGLRTSNERFLRSSTQNNYLYDDGQTLVRETRIQVEEPVLSREIYNVRYRFEDSRVYDETPIVQIIANRENNTEQEHMSEVGYGFEETRERFWRALVSLELGVSMGFSVGIPLIGSLDFEVSTTFRGEYEWGETKTEKWEFSDTYTFSVPPKSHVTAYMIASKATCDIPFSYTVRDVLLDGKTRIYEANDGVFTGVNSFNFGTKVESRPL